MDMSSVTGLSKCHSDMWLNCSRVQPSHAFGFIRPTARACCQRFQMRRNRLGRDLKSNVHPRHGYNPFGDCTQRKETRHANNCGECVACACSDDAFATGVAPFFCTLSGEPARCPRQATAVLKTIPSHRM